VLANAWYVFAYRSMIDTAASVVKPRAIPAPASRNKCGLPAALVPLIHLASDPRLVAPGRQSRAAGCCYGGESLAWAWQVAALDLCGHFRKDEPARNLPVLGQLTPQFCARQVRD
jgi:hypothetical protein